MTEFWRWLQNAKSSFQCQNSPKHIPDWVSLTCLMMKLWVTPKLSIVSHWYVLYICGEASMSDIKIMKSRSWHPLMAIYLPVHFSWIYVILDKMKFRNLEWKKILSTAGYLWKLLYWPYTYHLFWRARQQEDRSARPKPENSVMILGQGQPASKCQQ